MNRKKINNKKNIINKVTLMFFIIVVASTLLMKITISILFDFGFYDNKIHLGYFNNPEIAFKTEFKEFLLINSGASWEDFLDSNQVIKKMLLKHPHFFWMLMQFTWITAIVLIIMLSFRYFKFEDRVPKWLAWIMKQRTLSLLTMYEGIVAIVYWAWMFDVDFSNSPLAYAETINTIFIHAIIPVLLILYSIFYIAFNQQASMLDSKTPLIGIIYPSLYMIYYLILSIAWSDPYEISNIHNRINEVSLKSANYEKKVLIWLEAIYLAPIALVGVYVMLGFFTVMHNFTLFAFNKSYNHLKDYDALKQIDKRIKKIKKMILKKAYKKLYKTQIKT